MTDAKLSRELALALPKTVGRRTYTFRPLRERFYEKFVCIPESGCWIWMAGTDRNGYGFMFSKEHGKHRPAHRLSVELHGGTIPPGHFVCHTCDVPACVNPDHLFIGKPVDNVRDMMAKGRARVVRNGRGEDCPRARLSREQVAAIKLRLGCGDTLKAIAADYGVHFATIHHIKTGKSWGDVLAAKTLEEAVCKAVIAVGRK